MESTASPGTVGLRTIGPRALRREIDEPIAVSPRTIRPGTHRSYAIRSVKPLFSAPSKRQKMNNLEDGKIDFIF